MKKLIVITLCCAFIFNLSACAVQSNEVDANISTPTPILTVTTLLTPAPTSTPTPTPKMDTNEYDDVDTSSAIKELAYLKEMDMTEKYDQRQSLEEEYIDSVNGFSKQIAALLLKDQVGNAMISPISIQMALSLAGVGAEGTTKDEIFTSLGLEDKGVEYLSEQNAYLYQLLYTDNGLGKLSIANSLWMKQGMVFKEDYIERATKDFRASLYPVDFTEEATPKLMSKWVWENTGKLITPQINIDPEQILSIINTIYFKDEWITAFSEEATAPEEFDLTDGTKITCDFMNMTLVNQSYMKGDSFLSTALPLKNHGSMHFILPNVGVTVEDLLEDPGQLTKALNDQGGEMGKVILQIPKFSFESKFKLKDAMKALGVTSAFQKDANFRGITEEGIAFISDIEHQTHIGIDEKGVEAAAFTNITYCGSAMPKESLPIEITLDRPFIFAITEENVILFLGIVNNPLTK